MLDLNTYLDTQRRLIDSELDRHLPSEDTRPAILHTAMRYCLFSGGKRLRPILCLATAEALGGDPKDALLPALALEALHTYTLVHDDLPSMDDDDLRRGQPTAHIQFGEANAILTGDALLTLAFEWMAQCAAPPPHLPGQYALELAEAAGSRGVIAGQVEDIAASADEATPDDLEYIHLHKTAALIRAAVRIGAIAGQADGKQLDALSIYGCDLGLAFQITDDVLDETGNTAELGKPTGSDRKNKKLTYVSFYGIDAARQQAEGLIKNALQALSHIKGNTDVLQAIARFTIERMH